MEVCMENQVIPSLDEIIIEPLEDFQCLNIFCSGIESMDFFIRNLFTHMVTVTAVTM